MATRRFGYPDPMRWIVGAALVVVCGCEGGVATTRGGTPSSRDATIEGGHDAAARDASGVDGRVVDGCTPNCESRECGDDGCGGSCGTCAAGEACEPTAGRCIDTARCGDGVVDPGEVCDGACPTRCLDAPPMCMRYRLQGSADECTAQCVLQDETRCRDDGCCVAGCDATTDPDCAPECGNGVVEPGERCDGDCPTACPDRACVSRRLVGSGCDARCEDSPITACAHGDGCCPSGCDVGRDSDCALDCRDLASWPADWAAEEDAALAEMNRQRMLGTDCASGPKDPVPPIVMNDALRIAARCHSLDMATNNFFSHTGSDGSRFSQRARDAGYAGSPRFENIAAGNGTGVASVGQWMTSTTGHCDAVMSPDVTAVGIGYVRQSGTRWTHYWTAVFGNGG